MGCTRGLCGRKSGARLTVSLARPFHHDDRGRLTLTHPFVFSPSLSLLSLRLQMSNGTNGTADVSRQMENLSMGNGAGNGHAKPPRTSVASAVFQLLYVKAAW